MSSTEEKIKGIRELLDEEVEPEDEEFRNKFSTWAGPAIRDTKRHKEREEDIINEVLVDFESMNFDENNVPNKSQCDTTTISHEEATKLFEPHDIHFRTEYVEILKLDNKYHPSSKKVYIHNKRKVVGKCEELIQNIKDTLIMLKIHNVGFYPPYMADLYSVTCRTKQFLAKIATGEGRRKRLNKEIIDDAKEGIRLWVKEGDPWFHEDDLAKAKEVSGSKGPGCTILFSY